MTTDNRTNEPTPEQILWELYPDDVMDHNRRANCHLFLEQLRTHGLLSEGALSEQQVERAAAARALREFAQHLIESVMPEHGSHINMTPYREGLVDGVNRAVTAAGRRAAVPDAATEELERIKPLFENLSREYPNECNKRVKAEAERDAALAALERVRAVCLHLGGVDGDVSHPAPSYYVSVGRNVVATEVLAALDGAPEPEEKP